MRFHNIFMWTVFGWLYINSFQFLKRRCITGGLKDVSFSRCLERSYLKRCKACRFTTVFKINLQPTQTPIPVLSCVNARFRRMLMQMTNTNTEQKQDILTSHSLYFVTQVIVFVSSRLQFQPTTSISVK